MSLLTRISPWPECNDSSPDDGAPDASERQGGVTTEFVAIRLEVEVLVEMLTGAWVDDVSVGGAVSDGWADWVVTDGGIESLVVTEGTTGSPMGTGTRPGGVVIAAVEGAAVGAVRNVGGVVVGAMVSGARWSPGANPPTTAVVDDPDS
jgi:hypothetical protein